MIVQYQLYMADDSEKEYVQVKKTHIIQFVSERKGKHDTSHLSFHVQILVLFKHGPLNRALLI